MSNATESDLELQIGHVLLIDIVGYSKLLSNEQVQALQELNRVVRNAAHFRTADAAGKLIRIPTGDGMALLFFDSPEEPLLCALEISQALKAHPTLKLRMGAHSGPINAVSDVNDRPNFAGAGINLAQRVLDCGDAGHILLSDRVAEDLKPYKHWQPYLRDLGVCEVKHGVRLRLFNLCKDGVGNPLQPERVKQQHRRLRRMQSATARWVGDSPLRKAAVISGTVGAFLALVAVVWFSLARNRDELAQPKRMTANSIAVLPFENLSDDKQNAYFCDGVHDEILTGLSRVRDLKVISRTSVMQYRGKSDAPRNLREIARTLGVTHVLEGTVQRDGDRVRVSAQLIDPVTDTHVWADRYDRRLADVFAIESEIAQEIVTQLKATLSPEEKAAIEQRPTADIDAYDLYTRAKAILNAAALGVREKERLFEAEHLLKQAIARDPNFFLAYCLLARIHDRLYILGFDRTPARLQLAQTAIDTALKLRPTAGEGHLALAVHLYTRLDYARARQELDIAGRALPNEPLIFELRGYIDRRQGRWDDCLRNLREVEELDPRNYFNLQQIALALEKLRRFPDMISYLDRVLAIIPNDAGTRVLRALAELEWRADPKPL
ncbi:MAG TPA: FlgO family outer membrane protein, partial [Chthoniobacterales bacterium]|nr:FlgO family outer membrane protein [Chthoniobacterales bacterium]